MRDFTFAQFSIICVCAAECAVKIKNLPVCGSALVHYKKLLSEQISISETIDTKKLILRICVIIGIH